jgi:hypothetical protein
MKPSDGRPESQQIAVEASGRDRRVSRRLASGREVPVVLLAGQTRLGPAVMMRCINISKGGMRLEGPAPLVRGAKAAVELVSTASRRRAVVGIEVVYSHLNHHGDTDAGVRFVLLDEQTVAASFLDESGRIRPFDDDRAGLYDER